MSAALDPGARADRRRVPVLVGLLVLLLPPSACRPGPDLEVMRSFEEADRLMSTARGESDYAQAAALYESILRRGFESGAVYFNLGNAHFQAGNRGAAIAAYRQAERYRPGDPYLKFNLEHASGSSASRRARTWLDHVFFWQGWLSYPAKLDLATGAAALVFVLLLAAHLWPRRRRALRGGALVLGLSAGILFASFALDHHRHAVQRHGVVSADRVVARKGSSESYEPAFTEPLPEGTEFLVREQRSGWIRIWLERDLEGWIPSDKAILY